MSLKETLGLRSHKEDPKMFWFELTLLCLLAGAAGGLLSLIGLGGRISGALGGLAISWALVCAALTGAWNGRKRIPPDPKQMKLENQLLVLAAVLALPDHLLPLLPGGGVPCMTVLAGLCLYYTARIAGPKLRKKESFTMREILVIIACGVLACVLLISLVDRIAGVIPILNQET